MHVRGTACHGINPESSIHILLRLALFTLVVVSVSPLLYSDLEVLALYYPFLQWIVSRACTVSPKQCLPRLPRRRRLYPRGKLQRRKSKNCTTSSRKRKSQLAPWMQVRRLARCDTSSRVATLAPKLSEPSAYTFVISPIISCCIR